MHPEHTHKNLGDNSGHYTDLGLVHLKVLFFSFIWVVLGNWLLIQPRVCNTNLAAPILASHAISQELSEPLNCIIVGSSIAY